MKVQEDRNTQKVDQYGTSLTIWLMGQGLCALDGEALLVPAPVPAQSSDTS